MDALWAMGRYEGYRIMVFFKKSARKFAYVKKKSYLRGHRHCLWAIPPRKYVLISRKRSNDYYAKCGKYARTLAFFQKSVCTFCNTILLLICE